MTSILLLVGLCGCRLPDVEIKSMVSRIHIGQGGTGFYREEFRDIRPAKSGKEGKKQIQEFIQLVKDADTDNKSERCRSYYDKEGRLNAYFEESKGDILAILRKIYGSSSYPLEKDNPFLIQWDGKTLKLHLGCGEKAKGAAKRKVKRDPSEPEALMVFTTDGRFMESNIGEISVDGRSLVISDLESLPDDCIKFSVTGIAVY